MIIDVSKTNNQEVLNILVNHFNYSMKDVNDYTELTDKEKKFISKKIWDKIMIDV